MEGKGHSETLEVESSVQRSCGYLPGQGVRTYKDLYVVCKEQGNNDWELESIAVLSGPHLCTVVHLQI